MKRLVIFSLLLVVAVSALFADSGKKGKLVPAAYDYPYTLPEEPAGVFTDYVYVPPAPYVFPTSPLVGSHTGLTGFWDYQSNGGSVHYIRVDPATGDIHVILMVADDSANISASRRTAYGYSTDDGSTWNTFGNIRVPSRRSGFPTIDLGKGPDIAGAPLIANHADVGGLVKSIVLTDVPAGTGAFAEIATQPAFNPYEPIWPYVAGAADGSIIVHASPSPPTGVTLTDMNYRQRTVDFNTWSAWSQFPTPNLNGGRNSIVANGTGRVATIVHGDGSARVFESTDNGVTWGSPAEIYPAGGVIAGEDTIHCIAHSDLVYDGDTPIGIVGVSRRSSTGGSYFAGARFQFWRPGSSLVDAVPWDSVGFPRGFTWVSQSNQLPVCMPSLGVSGSRLVLVYTGYSADTTTIDTLTSRRFADVYYTQSTNGGITWADPVNLTNTPQWDERYASVSKWNPDGYAYVVWQEDSQAGAGSAGTPEAPVTRASQVFYKIDLTGTSVGNWNQHAGQFKLGQNYPNPFNPSTTIDYSVPVAALVTLRVFNVLGQEVATLVNEQKNTGTYQVAFQGRDLPSGVYYYRLTAGQYSETRRMALIK